MERRKRIALYGGTFDPVHVGHLAVARGLMESFVLDEVLFIPANVAPHKRGSEVSLPLHRYAMLALATQEESAWRVSTIELDAPEKPYSVETVTRVQDELGSGAQLFFIMGADSWAEITTWRDWKRLLTMTNHIVVARPGYDFKTSDVTPAICEMIVDLRGSNADEIADRVAGDGGTRIYVTDQVLMDVSATAIRKGIRNGVTGDWLSLVPATVANYIRKYGLYKKEYETKSNS